MTQAIDWKNPNYDAVYQERTSRLERMRQQPEIVARIKDYYATHPVEFINDWGCTFDPRNVEIGLRAVVPFILFPKQAEYILWVIDRWQNREDGLVEKSRDMGASWLCVAIAHWMWQFRPGTVVGFGSRKEEYVDKLGDSKSLFWKIREYVNLLPREFQPDGWSPKEHAPHMRIINPETSSIIVGEAGDNIGRGNRTSIYFKDESAFYERPDAVDAALSQTSNCKIDVSTPNGAGNPFYRKRHGGKVKVFIFDWRDDPRKGDDWYRRQQETLDPVVLAQEVDRDYNASVANAFISGEIVAASARKGPADVIPSGPLMCGVDVARFGDDKTIISFRRGRVLLSQTMLSKLDVVAVAGAVKRMCMDMGDQIAQIAVDTIGIGAGVADILRLEFGEIVVDVNSSLRMADGKNYNLRARMWSDMREWLKSGASIPNDPELQTELSALQYNYKGGELLIESKDDAKKRGIKSPDRADSLALTFAYPPAKAKSTDYLTENFAGWAVLDEISGY